MALTKKWVSNIIFGVLIALLLIPQTRVYFLKFLSFSPRTVAVEKRVTLTNYDWQLKGVNTTDFNFKAVEGKVAIVNFWATWCMPCVAEMPSLQYLYEDYKDKVVFILVTSDTPDKVNPFMTEKAFTLPVYNNYTQPLPEFETQTIPRTFLIDKQGQIVVDAGRADWNTKKTRRLLDDLLAQ
ncbi:MAG: thiol-disulfide oxidoreductase [Flavobacteriia bacterium]|nr:MAG: thiol-disulfide oxidoreductase [Flavobacteriia bacterium]